MINSSVMKLKQKHNVKFLVFNDFEKYGKEIIAVYSTRLGGVSEGIYRSMNLWFASGDNREKVLQNYKLFSAAVGVDYRNIVAASQFHNTNIKVVDKDDCGKGIVFEQEEKDFDGLITDVKNIPLVTFYADCVPLYFYDIEKKVIGLAHAGWKGTSKEIGKKMVDKFKEQYGSHPNNIAAAIGPSICSHCYEVGKEVKEIFAKMPTDVGGSIRRGGKEGKYFLDLRDVNKKVLLAAGIKEKNISVSDVCTMCSKDLLFSHRGHKGNRGSQVALMQLK